MHSTKTDYDLVVVGGGPAGSTAARFAAQQGLRVLLLDKRQELGAPIQCSGAVSGHALEEAGVPPDAEFIHEAIYGFGIVDARGAATTIDYRQLKPDEYGPAGKPLGYVVDRRRFDRFLVAQAERAGVTVWLKAEALGFEVLDDYRCAVELRHFNRPLRVTCRVVVGADGLQSRVGKWAGLRTHIKLSELASCLQVIVDGVETAGLLEIVTGHEWAPGGYAWVFPKGHGYAEVGLGVTRTMTPQTAQWHLDHFLKQSFWRDRFGQARILEVQGGGVPLAAPLRTQYASHVVLVGDAARHVNPITGGGIHTALGAGRITGNFLAELIQAGRPSTPDQLRACQQRWLDEFGAKMWDLYREKSAIFRERNVPERDRRLHATMASYFSPNSVYKKI